MDTIGKHLATALTGLLPRRAGSNVQRALDDRMTLSEAIEAAGGIVRSYPNGGGQAGDRYIGALAAMLQSYPRQVVTKCADPVHGIVRECKFLPTPADVVAWCEPQAEKLRIQVTRALRVNNQLRRRSEFAKEQDRSQRLSYAELKAKHGASDGTWGIDRAERKTYRWPSKSDLEAICGKEAWDKLPNAQSS